MKKTQPTTHVQWKPGQLAMLALRTGVEKPALRVEPAGEEGWVWHLLGEEFPGVAESGVIAARRLVVIDPEDDEQVDRLIDAMVSPGGYRFKGSENVQAALRSLDEGVTL